MSAISLENERKLSAVRLRSLLDYDPKTGIFQWKRANARRKAGERAGWIRPDGRNLIRIGPTRYLASRLAWLYVYGEWPERYVDHIDRDKANDAISNLRQADKQQNSWNAGVRNQNTLGLRNITTHRKRFVVRFLRGRETIFRQSFRSLDDAIRVRDAHSPIIYGAFQPTSPDLGGGYI